MILTVSQFDVYSGNCDTAESIVALKTQLLKSAQEIVTRTLGFDPESGAHTDFISGIGNNRLYLFAHPVTAVSSVELNGISIPSTEYTIHDTYLRLKEGVWPVGDENVLVSYTAGWSALTLPDTIKTVILEIATLLLMEAGENIGVTGKSFGENSRNFINRTNFTNWLKNLDPYKIVRLY